MTSPFEIDSAGNILPARPSHTRLTYKGRLYDLCPFKVEISTIYRQPKGAKGWKVQHLDPTGYMAWKLRRQLAKSL